jgi:hypothetical protein
MAELLDLSEIYQDSLAVRLVKDGPLYDMVPLSVLDFVRNMQDLKRIEAGNLEDEIKVVHKMIARSFPSMPAELIEKLTFKQIQNLQDTIGKVMSKAEESAPGAEGNPQTAVPLVGSTSDSSSPA